MHNSYFEIIKSILLVPYFYSESEVALQTSLTITGAVLGILLAGTRIRIYKGVTIVFFLIFLSSLFIYYVTYEYIGFFYPATALKCIAALSLGFLLRELVGK